MLSNALSFRLTPSFVVLSIPQQWLEVEGQAEGSSLTQTVFNGVNAMAGLALLVLPSVGGCWVALCASHGRHLCHVALYHFSLGSMPGMD